MLLEKNVNGKAAFVRLRSVTRILVREGSNLVESEAVASVKNPCSLGGRVVESNSFWRHYEIFDRGILHISFNYMPNWDEILHIKSKK